MNKAILGALLFLSLAVVGFAQDGAMKGKAGDYTVEARFDSATPVRGTNGLTVVVKDASGNEITDVTVVAEYYMTQVMAPTQKFAIMPQMSYHAPATLKGSIFRADLDLWMSGGWHIDVKVVDKNGTSKARLYTVVK
jgi:hypothetical protein